MQEIINNTLLSHYLRGWYPLCIYTGVLLAVPFIWSALWWSALLALVVFLCALHRHPSLTPLQIILGGLLMGTIQYFGVLSWTWSTYPLDWLAISPTEALTLIFFYTLGASLVMGVSKVLVIYGVLYTRSVLTLPLFWLLGEVVAAGLFSLYALGPGSSLQLHFSFGMLGYLLAEHQLLLPLARAAGVYGLTLLYTAFGTGLYLLFTSSRQHRFLVSAGLLVLLIVSAAFSQEQSTEDTGSAVAALETTFDRRGGMSEAETAERNQALARGVVTALRGGNGYIVLPEDARFSALFTDKQAVFAFLREHMTTDSVVLVDSSSVRINESSYVRAFLYDTKTSAVYEVDKQYLVPQGEYMPYLHDWLLRRLGYGKTIDAFKDLYDFSPGPNSDQSHLPSHLPRVLFCFESTSPYALKQLVAQSDPVFVAHPVSHAIFNQSRILQQQLDQMLRVNATFAEVLVYQSGNLAPALRY